MSNKEYMEKRLIVTGIEVPDNTSTAHKGTRVRLSNDMYLGGVMDLSLNGNQGDMWTVDVTVRTHITNEQVLELFGKIGHGKATETAKQTASDDTEGTETT